MANGHVRIDNIPMTGKLNLDDVVEVREEASGGLSVVKVIGRKYQSKTALDYTPSDDGGYQALCASLKAAGIRVEGLWTGVALTAHSPSVNPVRVAIACGLSVSLHRPQPDPLDPAPLLQ